MIEQGRIEAAVTEMLGALGEDPNREGLRETPRRIARMYAELFAGLEIDPRSLLTVSFDENHQEMVVMRNIPFYSMCEHHFLPFYGTAHLGYIPNGRVVGASKLARLVDVLAKRPQIQERLTTQIAETMVEVLKPDGVGVVMEAEHLCMTMRGIEKPGSRVLTSAMRGIFRRSSLTRSEFLALLQGK